MNQGEVDVCVIGSGAGGAVVAQRLGAAGLSVAVVEAGPRFDPRRNFHSHRPDREAFPQLLAGPRQYTWGPCERLQRSYSDLRSWSKARGLHNSTRRRTPPRVFRVKGVGGSTLHYEGEAHRLAPEGFRLRSLTGVGADWPISYEDLAPYYRETEAVLQVAGPHHNPFKPRREPYPRPPHPLGRGSEVVRRGCQELGLTLLPNSLAILSQADDGRPACDYCNGCLWGCMTGARSSMDRTFVPMAEATGRVQIHTEAVATQIELNGQERATGVVYLGSDGIPRRQKARVVVLAGGALESPRLLLHSACPAFPNGVANGSGTVGRFFQETITLSMTALFADRIDAHRGVPIEARIWDFNRPEKSDRFAGGVLLGVSALDVMGPVAYALGLAPGWGSEHKAFMREFFGHALTVYGVGEQLPHASNMVMLDPEAKDAHGIPLPRITTCLRPNDLEMLAFMRRQIGEILRAARAVEIIQQRSSYDMSFITHMGGTCRMGDDPRTSVVNGYGQAHDVRNLFVTDGSTFVTQGGGDSPSLTIHALAMRAADHLVREARRGNL